MRQSFIVTIVVCCGIGAAALGGRQARDAGGAQPAQIPVAGSAVVSGIVRTETSDPQPVRRATVRLTSDTGAIPQMAGTDDEGRFVFGGLRPGRYTVSASKAGFVTAFHGSMRPGRGPGVPIAVMDGQNATVEIRMTRGAVITGAITDPRGNPAVGISVTAVDTRDPMRPASPVRVTTDDRGVYRIFGLPAGEYLVSATPAPEIGRVGDGPVTRVTDADVQWARTVNAAGQTTAPPPARDARPITYAPVFYPGTTDVSAAASIRIAAGEERPGVDLSMRLVALARVAGTLVDMNSQPLSTAIVTTVPRRGDRPSPADALLAAGVLPMPRANVGVSGFTFTGVVPGQYTLIARTGSMQRGAAPPDPNAPPTQWAMLDLDVVDGGDRTDIALRLLPGVTVTGAISFDRAAEPPKDATAVDLSFIAVNAIPGLPATFRGIVAADGSFRVPSLAPGNYLVRAEVAGAAAISATGARWALKSAMAGSSDLADRPIAAVPGGPEVTGVAVSMTVSAAEISGRVIDAGNLPVTRYSIVVVSTNRTLWLPNGRRVRAVQPATDGSFIVGALPPGEYAIAAVENLGEQDLANAELLSRVVEAALKMTLAEGEKKRTDLKVGGSVTDTPHSVLRGRSRRQGAQ